MNHIFVFHISFPFSLRCGLGNPILPPPFNPRLPNKGVSYFPIFINFPSSEFVAWKVVQITRLFILETYTSKKPENLRNCSWNSKNEPFFTTSLRSFCWNFEMRFESSSLQKIMIGWILVGKWGIWYSPDGGSFPYSLLSLTNDETSISSNEAAIFGPRNKGTITKLLPLTNFCWRHIPKYQL